MNAKKTLLIGAISGFVVGVLFIYAQPLFGMSALTERHAAAYLALSDMSPSTAIFIAWTAHLLVSIAYGTATAVALLLSKNLATYALQILALGWFTTVIAGPANQLIVRLVSSAGFPALNNLPPLNFNLDAKLILHLLFFAFIALAIALYTQFDKRQGLERLANA